MTPPSPPDVAAEVADDVRSIEHALNRLRPDAYHPMFAPVLRRLITRLRAQDAAVREAHAVATAASPAPGGWRPTHRHRKRGTLYQVLAHGRLQAEQPCGDEELLVIYRGEDGAKWLRPLNEFLDGRFEKLPTPPGTDPVPPSHDPGAAEALRAATLATGWVPYPPEPMLDALAAAGWTLRQVRP